MGCLKIPYQREGAGEFPALKNLWGHRGKKDRPEKTQ
jgi:hypothetical protein